MAWGGYSVVHTLGFCCKSGRRWVGKLFPASKEGAYRSKLEIVVQIERKPVKGEQEKKSDRIWGKVGEGCGQEEESSLIPKFHA